MVKTSCLTAGGSGSPRSGSKAIKTRFEDLTVFETGAQLLIEQLDRLTAVFPAQFTIRHIPVGQQQGTDWAGSCLPVARAKIGPVHMPANKQRQIAWAVARTNIVVITVRMRKDPVHSEQLIIYCATMKCQNTKSTIVIL